MLKLNDHVSIPFKTATFGMGCFWVADSLFGATPGVLRTRVGYSGGTTLNPVYLNIGNHTEVIEIHFDPEVVSFGDLLKLFWSNHEYGVTAKVKTQYASLILYHDKQQEQISKESKQRESTNYQQDLSTRIKPAGIFYPAEDYHQKYRLQQHKWLCGTLGLNPFLLQTSHIAARMNGYVVGLGKKEDFINDAIKFGLPNKIKEYVEKEYEANKGGSLYCQ